jgi:hypothetical protein
MNTQINDLLQKRMDRKDFLKHIAIGIAVMTGGATLVKTLANQQTSSDKKIAEGGYGASAYGGATTQLKPMQTVRKIQ